MIDPRQRYQDLEQTIRLALGAFAAGFWTGMPGVVQSYNSAAATVVVQLGLSGSLQNPDGTVESNPYPLLPDVPVLFPRGGNCTLTFPIAAGDDCLVLFADRCIDAWWKNGGINNKPAESRMHDLSDGFALIGPFSQATTLSSVSTSTAQLRSNDGSTYVELNAEGQVINIVAPGGINITGNVLVTGTVTATENIKSDTDVIGGSSDISLVNHVHSGVQSGGSLTGAAQG